MSRGRIGYRPDIDGLRAIAVLSVVLCHAGLGLPGGYVGVDCFFVISGYLITGLILADLRRGEFRFSEFWQRRVRRIVPALAVVVVVTMILGWAILLPDDCASMGKSVLGIVGLCSNVVFGRESGYFEVQAEDKPLLHTWSLGVEEQFYLLMPVFLWFFYRRKAPRVALALMLAGWGLSFGLSIHGARYSPRGFYLLPNRAWELLTGAMLAHVRNPVWPISERMRALAAALGFVALLVPCLLYDKTTRFPGVAALPPVLGTALLIWSGSEAARLPWASRLLTARPVVFFGTISYSLYLWHWPLLTFTRYRSIAPLDWTQRVVIVVLSMLAAVVSWRFVECPVRNRKLFALPRQLAVAASIVGLATLAMGAALYRNALPALERPGSQSIRLFVETSHRDPRYFHEMRAKDVPAKLVRLGATDGPESILAWGDSHAMSILPALDAACRNAGIGGCAATHSLTVPAVDYVCPRADTEEESTRAFNRSVMAFVTCRSIPAVILVGHWRRYAPTEDRVLKNSLFKTVDRLKDVGAAVYFMKDVPEFPFEVPRALVLSIRNRGDLNSLAMPIADYRAANRFQESLVEGLKDRGVKILDPIPFLLSRTAPDVVVPFDAGGSFYFDSHHLSTHGAMALEPLFAELVDSVRSRLNPPITRVKGPIADRDSVPDLLRR